MENAIKLILYCGIGLLMLGVAYLVYLVVFGGYRLTPMDLISLGVAYIGFVMAWPAYKESVMGKPSESLPIKPS